jgi:hypothetical protein
MRLTIIAPDNVFELEVDPSMDVQDVQALIEAEVSSLKAMLTSRLACRLRPRSCQATQVYH